MELKTIIEEAVKKEGIDLIGFSGHIICHKPSEHILYQIGKYKI